MGQERAFRLDAAGDEEDKIYLSVRAHDPGGWRADHLNAHTAKAAEAALVQMLGPQAQGMRIHAVRSARQGVPIHIIQATFPWSEGPCTRIKAYHKVHTSTHAARAALGFPDGLEHPFDGTVGVEIYGQSWPGRERTEAYSFAPWTATLPTPLLEGLVQAGGVPCQTSVDTIGTTTWYWSTEHMAPRTAVAALQAFFPTPFAPKALARVAALDQAGWVWADFILQRHANGVIVPVAHLLHPTPAGLAFAI